jgi:hypothetical protein
MWGHQVVWTPREYVGSDVFGPGPPHRPRPTTSEVFLTLLLMDTYITLMIYICHSI